MNPWRVKWWYLSKRAASTTTFPTEEAARTFAAAMRKRGCKVMIRPV